MKQAICVGDGVVIVGGGNGISTVMASKLVGDSGDVIVFEGAESMIPIIRETLDIHSITNVEVRHNIVSKAISLYGDTGDSKIISPSELPECDTLVLDCEGAELNILSNLAQSPKSIVVETHGHFGAPTNEVMNEMSNYDVIYEQRISPSKDMSVLGYERN